MTRISVWPARTLAFAGVVCAFGALAPTLAAATTPASPAKPKPSSCSKTRENQSVTVRFRLHDHLYTVTGGQPEGLPPKVDNVRPPSNNHFGTLKIGAATCRSPKGWRVLSPLDVSSSSSGLFFDASNAVTPRGKGPARGWGIAVEKVDHGVMSVRAVACTQGHFWAGVRKLSSIPLPVSYTISVIQWLASSFIPLPSDKVRCGDLGTDQLHVVASRHGTLRVTSPRSERNMNGIFESSNQSAGGNDVSLDHTRTIQRPIIR
jgi:hypothetical protein